MSGFGRQPAGTSSAGWGTPAQATVQGGSMLLDPATRQLSGARLIDMKTRDYVVDAEHGRLVGMGAVPQIVQLAVSTEFGSAAVRDLGQKLRTIDRITNNFEQRCLDVLTTALRTAIDLKQVEVLGFSSFRAGPKDGLQPGQTYGRLKWRDLTTGAVHLETI